MRCDAQLLLALVGLDHRLSHQLMDKGEAHIRNGGGAVQAALLLHLHDDMLDHLFFVLIQLQGFLNAVVALHQLCGGKAHRDARRLAWSSMRWMMPWMQRCTAPPWSSSLQKSIRPGRS